MKTFKIILSIFVGFATGGLVIMSGEQIESLIFPLPAGIDKHARLSNADYERIALSMPTGAWLFLLLNYALAAFLAGIVCTILSGRREKLYPIIVGIIMTIAGASNLILIHHPLWVTISNIPEYLIFAFLGFAAAKQRAGAN